jgi:biotin-dependent carboxylase-like uncharacterized protein
MPSTTRGRCEFVTPGALAIVVDDGRTGWAHLAVGEAGAFDRTAYRRANRLVGNVAGAACVEFLIGPSLRWRFSAGATIAVCGISAAITVGGPQAPRGRVHHSTEQTITVPAGALVSLTNVQHGLRGYLAVRGGWDVPAVLGSRSHDTLSGLGPAPLQPGATLAIGTAADRFQSADLVPTLAASHDPLRLRLLPAPRASDLRLPRAALGVFQWQVSPDSNRVGVRLLGPPLPVRRRTASEPLVRGAVQAPPDGQLVVMGPDHPTTGGYPVIGVVADADQDLLAQARPGTVVRLTAVPHA